MKKLNLVLNICLLSLFYSSGLSAQTTIDAEFRPRIEFREGFRKPLPDTLSPGIITLQRTRLNADYKSKNLNARISLQDARIWGNSDNKTNSSKVEIYEVWFEYFLTSGLSLEIGRQPLKYDDQRLLASPNWSNTGIAHDVFVLKYKSSFLQAHAGFAYNNSKDTLFNAGYSFGPKQNYKLMSFAWLSKSILKNINLSLIGIYEGFESKTNYEIIYPRITYGGNITYGNDTTSLSSILTAYIQKGKTPTKTYAGDFTSLDAFFIAAKASYKITKDLSASLGCDYYSGSAADSDLKKSFTFNRLYGTTHTFNGTMEYYVTLPVQGLIDYYAGIDKKITSEFAINLTAHTFCFDKDFFYNKSKVGKNLGSELDLLLNYAASKEVEIQGGYSLYFNSGATLKYFKIETARVYPKNWAYVMFTIKPQFFRTSAPVENNK